VKAVPVADADRDGLLRLVIDNERLAGPDLAAATERLVPADAAPVAGKPGLSAQLRAAGRQGLLHDRQALLKSLHDSVRG
jgi:hypothetical protein